MTKNDQKAREWAKQVKNTPDTYGQDELAAADIVLANTSEPTMDHVKWSDYKHSFAAATHELMGDVVMLAELNEDEILVTFAPDGTVTWPVAWRERREFLTPADTRYQLCDIVHMQELRAAVRSKKSGDN